MVRIMLDTDNLADLDGRFELLATYSDLVPDTAALAGLRARFPDSEIVLIDRGLGDPTGQASIADIEPGALGAGALPRWVAEKKAAGIRYLTGYCDRDNLPGVEAIARHQIWHMVATLDGTCHIAGFTPMRGPAVVQILGEQQLGVHADLSLVLEDGWHPRDQPAAEAAQPAAPPAPAADLDAAGFAARCPAWELHETNAGWRAALTGTRTQLEADSIRALADRIAQLYPGTVRP